jgi:hypothetical protein
MLDPLLHRAAPMPLLIALLHAVDTSAMNQAT